MKNAKRRKGKPVKLHPINELATGRGRREAEHLRRVGVSDSSMVFLVDNDGAELVTVNPSVYKRLASKVGQANVFNLDYVVEDTGGEAK